MYKYQEQNDTTYSYSIYVGSIDHCRFETLNQSNNNKRKPIGYGVILTKHNPNNANRYTIISYQCRNPDCNHFNEMSFSNCHQITKNKIHKILDKYDINLSDSLSEQQYEEIIGAAYELGAGIFQFYYTNQMKITQDLPECRSRLNNKQRIFILVLITTLLSLITFCQDGE